MAASSIHFVMSIKTTERGESARVCDLVSSQRRLCTGIMCGVCVTLSKLWWHAQICCYVTASHGMARSFRLGPNVAAADVGLVLDSI